MVENGPSLWTDHSEDLKIVIFGQCALQFYQSQAEILASPSDIDAIDELVGKHPLNATKSKFGKETCTNLMHSLFPVPSEPVLQSDMHVELLRQVKLYIERGLAYLKSGEHIVAKRDVKDAEVDVNRPVLEPPKRTHKRTRSRASRDEEIEDPVKEAKRQKVEEQPVEKPTGNAESPEKPEITVDEPTDQAEEADIEVEEPKKDEEKDEEKDESKQEEEKEESKQEEEPEKQKPEPQVEETEKPAEEVRSEKPAAEESKDDEIPKEEEKTEAATLEVPEPEETVEVITSIPPQPEPQEALSDARAARRRSRARRSARSTPEPTPEPAEGVKETKEPAKNSENKSTAEAEEGKMELEEKSAEIEKQENQPEEQEDQKEQEEQPKQEEEGTSSARSSATPSVPPSPSPSPEEESKEGTGPAKGAAESIGKRKRSVTFDNKDSEGELSPLQAFIRGLLDMKALKVFKTADTTPETSVVLHPTSLSIILDQINDGSLGNIDEVEVELLKMVANSVMSGEIDQQDTASKLAIIDEALTEFRTPPQSKPTASSPPPSAGQRKRRRR